MPRDVVLPTNTVNPPATPVAAPESLAPVRPSLQRRLSSQWRRWPGTVLRVALMALPIAFIARHIDGPSMLANARRVGPRGLALSVALQALATLLSTVRWRYLMRAYGADASRMPSFMTLVRANFVGLYFSQLPSGMAGDAMRGFRVSRCWSNPTTPYMVLFVERLTGLFGLLTIAAVAMALSPDMQHGFVSRSLDAGISAAFVLSAAAFLLPQAMARLPRLRGLVARIPVVGSLLAGLPAPVRPWGPLAVLPIAIVVHLLIIASVAVLVGPLDAHASFLACCRVVPAVMLLIQVPVTPGAMGQRELAFVQCFATIGVAREAALVASLLYWTASMGPVMLGGLALAYERARGGSRALPSAAD